VLLKDNLMHYQLVAKGINWLRGKIDSKEEVRRNHSSSTSTQQNAPWKQEQACHPNESKLTLKVII
jgi:hypothetical protein